MTGARLKGANLTDADLRGAIGRMEIERFGDEVNGPVYCNTIMPNGKLNNSGCNR